MLNRVSEQTWIIKKAKGLCYVKYCRSNSFTHPQTGEVFDCCLKHYMKPEAKNTEVLKFEEL